MGEMQQAESHGLLAVQEWAVGHFSAEHRFVAADVRLIHRRWLGSLYPWAGEYRHVNVAKAGFMFAAALQVPRLMQDFEQHQLRVLTPCRAMSEVQLVRALARTHAELVIIHPFREGNGRCARLLSLLMGLQAGLPPLDFSPLLGRGKRAYIAAIHAAVAGDYVAMEVMFARVTRRTWRAHGGGPGD